MTVGGGLAGDCFGEAVAASFFTGEVMNNENVSTTIGTFAPDSIAGHLGGKTLTVQDMQDLQDAYDNGQMYRRLMSNSVRRVIKILGLQEDQSAVSDMARDIVLNGVEPQQAIRMIKKFRGEA